LEVLDLRFLEIRHDPYIVDRNDIEQGDAGRNQSADADLAVANNAAYRRTHHGAAEIDWGKVSGGLGLRHGGTRRFALSGKDGDALLLSLYRCRRRQHA